MLGELADTGRRRRDPRLVHQFPVQPRARPVRQDLRRHLQRIRVGMPVERHVMGHDDDRQRPAFLDDEPPRGFRSGLGRDVPLHRARRPVDAAEVGRRQFHGAAGVDIASDDHGGVRRYVKRPVERAHLVERRGLETRHRADGRMLVRVRRERVAVHDFREPPVWLVVAHPPSLESRLPLSFEGRLVDAQRRHAVRFEPERHRQELGRHGFPEHRDVLGGVRVGLPANACDERRVLSWLDVFRAREHQALEKMREPAAPRPVVLRSDVVPHLDVDDRGRVIFVQDEPEPVRQRRIGIVQLRRPDLRHGARPGRRDGGQRQPEAPGGDTPHPAEAGPAAPTRFGAFHLPDYGTSYSRGASGPAPRLASTPARRFSRSARVFLISGRRLNRTEDLSQSRLSIAG